MFVTSGGSGVQMSTSLSAKRSPCLNVDCSEKMAIFSGICAPWPSSARFHRY